MRFFNTEGPVRPDDHYCLPPLSRWDLGEILMLIDQKKSFLLHAPRQTGKTSCLLALMERLNAEGRYRALYANIESAQAAREDVARGMAPGRGRSAAPGARPARRLLAGLGLDSGWLVIFDRRPDQPPIAERTERLPAVSPGGRRIQVIRG